MPSVDIGRRLGELGGIGRLQHGAPQHIHHRIDLIRTSRTVTTGDAGLEVLRETDVAKVQSGKDVGVLMHLAVAVCTLILRVRPDHGLDHRVDRHVAGHVGGKTEQPGERLILFRSRQALDHLHARA